jgi:hypothetical protein
VEILREVHGFEYWPSEHCLSTKAFVGGVSRADGGNGYTVLSVPSAVSVAREYNSIASGG